MALCCYKKSGSEISFFFFLMLSAPSPLPWSVIFCHIPFSDAVWDTVRYSGQRDTAKYNTDTVARYVRRIQLDTMGYSGIQWICDLLQKWIDADQYRGYMGIPRTRIR